MDDLSRAANHVGMFLFVLGPGAVLAAVSYMGRCCRVVAFCKVEAKPMTLRALILVATCVALTFGSGCEQSPSRAPDSKPLSAEQQKAVNFAQAFLKTKGIDWGDPSEVREALVEYLPGWKGEGYYQVTYSTPPDEVKKLGDRSVVVEIKSGRVKFVPRD